jgi:hypothetical protein
MKQKKTILMLGIVSIIALITFGGISTDYFSPVSTDAQQTQANIYGVINQKAKQNKATISLSQSKEIVGLLIENLSVLDIPVELQTPTIDQVANAHLNGASLIDENNIAIAVNNLASQSSAPNYAFTNTEQVKVVRTFLNRLIPDLVSANGSMNDLEAFAVFIATVSQKVDNDAFMVTPAEFTTSMGNSVAQPFPGSSAASTATVPEVGQESAKAAQMLGIINSYAGSKRRLSSNNIVSMIGIQ